MAFFCALLLAGSAFAADPAVKTAPATAPAVVENQPAPSPWTLSLGVTTVTPANSFGDEFTWGGEVGLSRAIQIGGFTTDLGYRQSVGYGVVGSAVYGGGSTTYQPPCDTGTVTIDTPGEKVDKDGFMLRSEIFWDWNIKLSKKFTFFAGPSLSFVYGDVNPVWYAGPEAGFKYDVTEKVFVFTRANYDFALQGCGSDDVRFMVGAGFRF